ncbi:fructose-1,6-bisphosphatase class 1 [Devosia pacifica]|uniref:Fructose-1,6-bisphosphatase class 1 n=1 Tax=Devosia pacifica TaxID=1335967 RepID=A0A918SE71_9HYPH|nr:class 1 fructose-bisphosphatase [Devosia pacifica]GHA34396.1 fructose-1,6-bisphosphatase class 1 [Devosia pacifica]
MARTNLSEWLLHRQVPPKLAETMTSVAAACAEIAEVLRTAPIEGISGVAGTTNVQGEDQKQLDVVSNDIFIEHLRPNRHVSALVSEELEEPLLFERSADEGGLAIACDPLDGSSNLDVNVTVGSIFSFLEVPADDPGAHLLQPGTEQIAAGYAAYGNSTSLVLVYQGQASAFTLDASGDFVLTAATLTIPSESAEYAINAARERFWDEATRTYVADSVKGEDGPLGKRYNMRWVGSMVADIHRILMRGGVFLYPLDSETVAKGGRLRLLYEANPMALIVEAAGGRASTGPGRLLEAAPSSIHQRIPVILGSSAEVERIERLYQQL